MKIIENKQLNEKIYIETLSNGMTIYVLPKHNTEKKFVVWATKYGSIDNKFIEPGTDTEIEVPEGVAHYLEHKMFEQENGVDSLYVLMGLGLDANAYTTDSHTAYFFSGTKNFYEGLDELMDYFQHPYFTDENVEKERGIIGQEIRIGEDEPFNKLYYNCMKCMYKTSPVRLDVAGTKETIAKITKETLYSCWNTFYHPANTIMCVVGNFVPEEIVKEIEKRMLPREKEEPIKRIYPEKDIGINEKKKYDTADVNMPMIMCGIKDDTEHSTIDKIVYSELILNCLFGEGSKFYEDAYESGLIMSNVSTAYEKTEVSSHIMIYGESKDPEKLYEKIVNEMQNHEITEDEFERSKKKAYGAEVASYNDAAEIGKMLMQSRMQGIDIFDYIDKIKDADLNVAKEFQKELFREDNCVLSIVKSK